jgi:hypothetical protein
MRILLALLLCLAACGAESPTPSTGDASTATDAAGDGPCGTGFARIGGACVSSTESNCGGIACPRNTFCTIIADGTTTALSCERAP